MISRSRIIKKSSGSCREGEKGKRISKKVEKDQEQGQKNAEITGTD
jgi:hypothetical protein